MEPENIYHVTNFMVKSFLLLVAIFFSYFVCKLTRRICVALRPNLKNAISILAFIASCLYLSYSLINAITLMVFIVASCLFMAIAMTLDVWESRQNMNGPQETDTSAKADNPS